MKNKLIITLLLITTISIGLVADPPPANPTTSFGVTTSISGINDMKITNTTVDTTTYGNPNYSFGGTVAIASSGDNANMDSNGNVSFAAYISTLSNNRKGYTITMSATALTSEGTPPATINYTVTVNNVSYATKTDTAAVDVLTVSSLGELDTESLPISVQVVRSEYDSAVQGSYTGTVTFNYVANN